MGPTWGQSGDDRAQVVPMLAPRTLLSGPVLFFTGTATVIRFSEASDTNTTTIDTFTTDTSGPPHLGSLMRIFVICFFVSVNKWLGKVLSWWCFDTTWRSTDDHWRYVSTCAERFWGGPRTAISDGCRPQLYVSTTVDPPRDRRGSAVARHQNTVN